MNNVNVRTGVIALVLFALSMITLGTAKAGDRLGTAGDGQTHAHDQTQPNHWNNPNNSIGNCSKDGKFCWNITIGDDDNTWGFPIEYYGNRARRLIADGQIEWANMDHHGNMYLGVWSRFDNRPFDCRINIGHNKYHCQTR